MILQVVCAWAIVASGPAAGLEPERAEVVARLRATAEAVDAAELSPLFRAILRPESAAGWPFAAETVATAREAGELARDLLRGWLLRGLEADAPPDLAALDDRLAAFPDLRVRVARHAEAIVVATLVPGVDALALRLACRPAESPPVGRDGPAVDRGDWAAWSDDDLRFEAGGAALIFRHPRDSTSPLVQATLDRAGKGLGGLDPAAMALAMRLRGLTCGVQASWTRREVVAAEHRPRAELIERLALVRPVRLGVQAHADALLLAAVVPREQADDLLRATWRKRRLGALRDPILARRLRLTAAQRGTIASIDDRRQALAGPLPRRPGARPADDPRPRAALDAATWDALTPIQARAFRRILARPRAQRAGGGAAGSGSTRAAKQEKGSAASP